MKNRKKCPKISSAFEFAIKSNLTTVSIEGAMEYLTVRERLFALLMAVCGLTPREIIRLKYSDVMWSSPSIAQISARRRNTDKRLFLADGFFSMPTPVIVTKNPYLHNPERITLCSPETLVHFLALLKHDSEQYEDKWENCNIFASITIEHMKTTWMNALTQSGINLPYLQHYNTPSFMRLHPLYDLRGYFAAACTSGYTTPVLAATLAGDSRISILDKTLLTDSDAIKKAYGKAIDCLIIGHLSTDNEIATFPERAVLTYGEKTVTFDGMVQELQHEN